MLLKDKGVNTLKCHHQGHDTLCPRFCGPKFPLSRALPLPHQIARHDLEPQEQSWEVSSSEASGGASLVGQPVKNLPVMQETYLGLIPG